MMGNIASLKEYSEKKKSLLDEYDHARPKENIEGFFLFSDTYPSDIATQKHIESLENNITLKLDRISERIEPKNNLLRPQSISIIRPKVIVGLICSSFLTGIIFLMTILSSFVSIQPEPIFWASMFFPFLGIAVACTMILLGVDKERYES